jgi:hypothetical protein
MGVETSSGGREQMSTSNKSLDGFIFVKYALQKGDEFITAISMAETVLRAKMTAGSPRQPKGTFS